MGTRALSLFEALRIQDRIALLQAVEHLEALEQLPEDGVAPVQVRRGPVGHEDLVAAGSCLLERAESGAEGIGYVPRQG